MLPPRGRLWLRCSLAQRPTSGQDPDLGLSCHECWTLRAAQGLLAQLTQWWGPRCRVTALVPGQQLRGEHTVRLAHLWLH